MADEGINVAILKGLIQMDYDPGKLATFLDQLTLAKAKQISAKTEGDRLKQSFDKLSASLDPVVARTLKYNQSVDILNKSLKAGIITQAQYNTTLAQAKERLQDTTTWTQRLGSEISGGLKSQLLSMVNPTTLAVGAVVGGLALLKKIIGDITKASIEAEESQRKVGFAVEQYGARAGITVQQIDELANAQSRLTGADDEEIASAAALALRFNRLSGEDLPRLTRVAQDMAVVLGTDIPSAMDKAAAYVNQPLQALTKLKKEGYAVGESQSKLIKEMLRTGDIAGAQNEIFKILEEQYGGASIAARDTLGGALKALGTEWENFLEKVGEDRLGPLRGGVEKLIDLIVYMTDKLDEVTLGWVTLQLNIAKADLLMARFVSTMSKLTSGGIITNKSNLDKSKKAVEELEKAQAKLILKQILPPGAADFLEEFATGHKKVTGAVRQQTEAEDNLNKKLRDQADALAKVITKQQEDLKYQREKLALASLPPGTDQQFIYEQLQKINDEHEYRLDLLAKIEQFGPKIGKQLADTDRELKKLAKDADLKFKLQFIMPSGQIEKLRSGIIDLFGGVQQGIDQGMNQLLAHLGELSKQQALDMMAGQSTDPVTQANEQMFADLQSQFREFWEDYAAEVRAGWMSNTDVVKREMEKVEAAYINNVLTIEEKERELARLRGELLANHLSEWGSFFGTLGGMFGGIFDQIASAINNIQRAQALGNQFGGLMQSAGLMGSQMAGAMGYMGATLAIMYEIYKGVDAQIKKNRARKWDTETQLEIVGGEWSSPSHFSERGEAISKELNQMIRDILDSLDAVISDLPQISIRARRDGKEFSAYVAGVFVGTFTDAETAIAEGVRYALASGTFDAISKEMAQALKMSLNATMDELQQNIETANMARRARLGDEGFAYAELNDQWLRQIDQMRRLGLAIDDAIAQKNRELEAYKNNVIGMDMASVERLRSLQSLSDGLAEAADVSRAAITQQMEDIQRQLELAQRARGQGSGDVGQGERNGEGGAGSGLSSAFDYLEIDETTAELQRQLEALQAELDKIPEALSEVEVDMGIFNVLREYLPETAEYAAMGVKFAQMEVEKKFQELKLTLIAMGEWEQWAAVWNDAYNNAMQLAGREGKPRSGGGGGGRAGGRDEVRDFIGDRREDLRLEGLSEHARAIAELDRIYQPMLDKAGKDIGLRTQLLALKDAEIRQLEQQNIRDITSDFQDFIGLANSFDEVRDNASGLIDRIEDSAMGDPRKANMISRVLGQMNAQIDKMSKEKALSLFDSMASDLISLGATEESLADARKAMALIDHQLKMENYRTEIEILRAKGTLDDATMAIIDDAFNRLQNIDLSNLTPPPPGPPPGGAGYYDWITNPGVFQGYGNEITSTIDDVGNSLQEAQDLFQQYVDEGLSPFNRDLRDLNEDFAIIFEQMGQGPEVMNQYALAMERLNEQYSGDLEELLNDLNFGANTDLSLGDQLSAVMAQFNQVSAEIASGDLSNAGLYRSLGQQALDLLGRTGGSGSVEFDQFRERLRQEVNLVLGNSGGAGSSLSGNLLPLNSSVATDQTTDLLGNINQQSGRQVNRLDAAVGLLQQLVTAVNRPPVTGTVRLNIGSDPTIPRINQ